jgi:anti-sigma28 factor (negative regulator of flagellin synthesis)
MNLALQSMKEDEVILMRKIQNSTKQDAAATAAQPPYEPTPMPQPGMGQSERTIHDAGTRAMERLLLQATGEVIERAFDPSEARAERVQRIRCQIAAGTYHVPSRVLAERLLRNMLGDYR